MFDSVLKKLGKTKVIIILSVIVFLNLFLLPDTLFSINKTDQSIYFLDVGQGDSQLIDVGDRRGTNIQILIDGGLANGKVLSELVKALGPSDRYIDIVILTHSDIDHFGGLMDVLQSYKVGVFVYNGIESDSSKFQSFKDELYNTGVKVVILGKGDSIFYKDLNLDFLLPEKNQREENINESSIVTKVSMKGVTFLLTGDIGYKTEKLLREGVSVDILKVAHHGSKFSSSLDFLERVNPKISVIQVGKNNYGHPTEEVLNNIALVGSQVFRNDIDGTIKIKLNNNQLNIYANSK